MRTLLILLATTAVAQRSPQTHPSHTTENLRGASTVSQTIAWASGSHGTYLPVSYTHLDVYKRQL